MHIIHNLELEYQNRIILEDSEERNLYKIFNIPEKYILEMSDCQKELQKEKISESQKSHIQYKNSQVFEQISQSGNISDKLIKNKNPIIINPSLTAIENCHLLCTVSYSYLCKK